jgi:GNAT superfamily N-acetyltransferase
MDFHPPSLLFYGEFDIEKGFSYNQNVFVDPRYRHRGIGARLLAMNEDICKASGLTILINNNRNPAFWRAQGYRRLNPLRQMMLARNLSIEFKQQSMYKDV